MRRRKKDRLDAANQQTSPALARVLDQSEDVQRKVEDAAEDLSAANTVLKKEVREATPLIEVVEALDRSVNAEEKVTEASAELVAVNDALAAEIDDRIAVEHELQRSNAALVTSRLEERRSRHHSLHDGLTGLPNMALFTDRLTAALAQAQRHQWVLAVMFIDLDNFKQLNDAHGHSVGDGVLRLVADRLQGFVRDGDAVSRRSGDEFLFLMLEAGDVNNAREMAQKIIAMIAAPCVIDGLELSVQASIGLAMYPEDATEPAELLKRADRAMYEAKRQPSGSVPAQRKQP